MYNTKRRASITWMFTQLIWSNKNDSASSYRRIHEYTTPISLSDKYCIRGSIRISSYSVRFTPFLYIYFCDMKLNIHPFWFLSLFFITESLMFFLIHFCSKCLIFNLQFSLNISCYICIPFVMLSLKWH